MESRKQFNPEPAKRNAIGSHRKFIKSRIARRQPPTMASPAGISDQKIEARQPCLDLAKAHKLPAAPWLLSALSGFEPVTAHLIRGLGSVAAADWRPKPDADP